jgi:DNA-binding protein H-NS
MKSYSAIKAEIAKLEKQAKAALRSEVAGVVEKIKKAIEAYGLTAADLGFGGGKTKKHASTRRARAATKAATTTTGVAKYRDPQTQKTWTGRGKPPAWIAGAKDRDAYLIAKTPKPTPAKKKARAARKTRPAPVKTAAVQIESGAASQ